MSGLLLALLSPALADETPLWGGRQIAVDEPVETSLVSAKAELSGSLESLEGEITEGLQPTSIALEASLSSSGVDSGSSLQSSQVPGASLRPAEMAPGASSLQPTERSLGTSSLQPTGRAPGGSLKSLGGGSAAETARIPPSEAQAVLKSAYPQLHACVQEHLGPARVELTLEIDVWIDGTVQQVHYEGALDQEVRDCMTTAIRRLRFSSPGGEVAVPVRSSLWFAGAEETPES